jgi:small subunit ribosomal protein S8
MVNDPVGDFIIRLKNAGAVKKASVSLPYSDLKYSIALALKNAGFVGEVEKHGKRVKKTLEVDLAYGTDGAHKIAGVKRVSKPGRRLYVKSADIHPVKYGKGLLMLSTPQGIMTGDAAKKAKVGGEMLFEIW